MNRRLQAFEPILSTKVFHSTETRLCYQTLNELYAQLKLVRDVTVVDGMLPANGLFGHQCTVEGNDLTAREVLLLILDQMQPATALVIDGYTACVNLY